MDCLVLNRIDSVWSSVPSWFWLVVVFIPLSFIRSDGSSMRVERSCSSQVSRLRYALLSRGSFLYDSKAPWFTRSMPRRPWNLHLSSSSPSVNVIKVWYIIMTTHSEHLSCFKLFTGLIICFGKSVCNLTQIARHFNGVDKCFFVIGKSRSFLIFLQFLR
jgi:hypothetical protein